MGIFIVYALAYNTVLKSLTQVIALPHRYRSVFDIINYHNICREIKVIVSASSLGVRISPTYFRYEYMLRSKASFRVIKSASLMLLSARFLSMTTRSSVLVALILALSSRVQGPVRMIHPSICPD